jgi:hypothetical protein
MMKETTYLKSKKLLGQHSRYCLVGPVNVTKKYLRYPDCSVVIDRSSSGFGLKAPYVRARCRY